MLVLVIHFVWHMQQAPNTMESRACSGASKKASPQWGLGHGPFGLLMEHLCVSASVLHAGRSALVPAFKEVSLGRCIQDDRAQ